MGAAVALRVRMLLVDDHPVVRRGVRDILAHAFPDAAIDEVGSGTEALALVRAQPWDIVVLDLTLPDGSGLDVLKRIRDARRRLPVLVLSMHAAEQFAHRAFAAGASAYLTKETADRELVVAARRLLRGERYVGSHGIDGTAAMPPRDSATPPHHRLSDREFEVLRCIGRGRAVTAIAHELGLSVKTVSTYRARVLEKMQMTSNGELIRYVVEHRLADA